MKCCSCNRHLIAAQTSPRDQYTTTLVGSKLGFQQQLYCGHCAQDMGFDENGNTALERMECERITTSATP